MDICFTFGSGVVQLTAMLPPTVVGTVDRPLSTMHFVVVVVVVNLLKETVCQLYNI